MSSLLDTPTPTWYINETDKEELFKKKLDFFKKKTDNLNIFPNFCIYKKDDEFWLYLGEKEPNPISNQESNQPNTYLLNKCKTIVNGRSVNFPDNNISDIEQQINSFQLIIIPDYTVDNNGMRFLINTQENARQIRANLQFYRIYLPLLLLSRQRNIDTHGKKRSKKKTKRQKKKHKSKNTKKPSRKSKTKNQVEKSNKPKKTK